MSRIDFTEVGKHLALVEMGVSGEDAAYYLHEDIDSVEKARLASNFCKEAASVLPYLGEGGDFAKVLFEKIANQSPEDLDPAIVDFVLESALEFKELTKSSATIAGVAGAGTTYVPSLLKGFLALAALGGATGGAAMWAGRKALQGPDEDEIAKLEAGIREYHKLRGRVDREKRNREIENKYL